MKNYVFLLSVFMAGQTQARSFVRPPHMDLEMSTQEYQAILKLQTQKQSFNKTLKVTADDPEIALAIQLGERLSKWINLVNTGRTPETAIRLTSKLTRRAIPIEKPNRYNTPIIKADTAKALAELPDSMKEVLLSSASLPPTIPVDDVTFIKHARVVDFNYQSAVRYKSNLPWKDYYKQAAASDVRGYYYLKTNKIGANELRDVSLIPADKVQPIKDALVTLCFNSSVVTIGLCQNANPQTLSKCNDVAEKGLLNCQSEVTSSFDKNELVKLHDKYLPTGISNWDDFFIIPSDAARTDFTWTDSVMTVVFNTPEFPRFVPYLQDNIEDEYKFGNWKLKMVFGTFALGPRLVFKAGETPHVNGLGGSEITMDSNQPIEEYESQWTIRHEFGHVLGMPDCYHEFFDVNLDAFVNYQLDTTDIMCSRAGNMKERIYTELKKAYKK